MILFDGVQVPHYNYVGDSILGYKAHMGAGSITSNVRSDKALVKVHAEDGDIETGLKKFGAMIGDCVEVGCGSVLNPGTVIGKNSSVYRSPASAPQSMQTPSTNSREKLRRDSKFQFKSNSNKGPKQAGVVSAVQNISAVFGRCG